MKDDTLVVGAYAHDHNGVANTGAAYVFTRDSHRWTQVGCLTQQNSGCNLGTR